MYIEYLKNPIILGLLSAIIIYIYLYYVEKNKEKENIKRKPVSVIIPALIGIIVWFVSGSYLNMDLITVDSINGGEVIEEQINNISDLSIPEESYHLIGKNKVRLPDLNDVLIDVADF